MPTMQPDGLSSIPARSRRWFLQMGAAWTAALAACTSKNPAGTATAEPRALGAPVSGYGSRSRFEKTARYFNQNTKVPLEEASSRTPLHDTYGIITPSSLHFERHHSGVPEIDPAQHTLTIHGLVDRPLVFTVDELKRLPSVSRIYFLECSGNSGGEWRGGSGESDVQRIHGLTSCSEWTGVPVSTLLRECGVQPSATWVLAEGADAGKHDRSIPIKKLMDDALVVYAQNGEPLRPEQGYPLRLFLPGWEGNANVKWLRRLKAMNQPAMTREETSKYTDLMADGTARQFTFDMDPKSLITRPSGGDALVGQGPYEVTGIAWTGRGTITSVEVTTDGGATWARAELQTPVLPRAHTRFRYLWTWTGGEALLASRCSDDTGYTQPRLADLVAVRGVNSNYHNNGIQAWKVASDGKITNGNSAALL
jgi:sulfane dehydrogenase subunit SoxC